jgi:hypothetical protein
MDPLIGSLVPSNVQQQSLSKLLKRIRKLRWIGLEDEAERLQIELSRNIPSGGVLTMPRDTD